MTQVVDGFLERRSHEFRVQYGAFAFTAAGSELAEVPDRDLALAPDLPCVAAVPDNLLLSSGAYYGTVTCEYQSWAGRPPSDVLNDPVPSDDTRVDPADMDFAEVSVFFSSGLLDLTSLDQIDGGFPLAAPGAHHAHVRVVGRRAAHQSYLDSGGLRASPNLERWRILFWPALV